MGSTDVFYSIYLYAMWHSDADVEMFLRVAVSDSLRQSPAQSQLCPGHSGDECRTHFSG